MKQKTGMQISDEIIKNTTKCKKKFSCLSGERNNLCNVELNIEDKIYFVKCMNNKHCEYRIAFGYSFVCLCPVRKELFKLYNI